MKWAYLIVGIATPLAAAWLLGLKIRTDRIKEWQAIACFTALVAVSSLASLLATGLFEGFELGGAKLKLVDQRVEEATRIREQVQRIAEANAELATQFNPGFFSDYRAMFDYYDRMKMLVASLPRESGVNEQRAEKILLRIEERRKEALDLIQKEKKP
jgi:hypothetical protein